MMSVHGMKPQFKDWNGYQAWIVDWRGLYAHVGSDIQQSKATIKRLQKAGEDSGSLQRELRHKRVMAQKLMTVRNEAKIQWQNIKAMKKGLADQAKEYPISLETKNIDFHFNKKSLEYDFIPMWVVKARGKTFYVNHVECQTGFTTRETPDHPSTKGSIRVKRGTLNIDVEGNALIS
jgi:hypothetical protein